MMAYCGLVCDECPIHLATLETDPVRRLAMREDIVRQCATQYGVNLPLSDVSDCDGCRADSGKLFTGCRNCQIRSCAMLKDIDNCAHCADYPCQILTDFFRLEPDAQTRLDAIHETI